MSRDVRSQVRLEAVNAGCEVCVLVVETPLFSLHRVFLDRLLTDLTDKEPRFSLCPVRHPPAEPFRNGAGESVPPDGTYVPKKR